MKLIVQCMRPSIRTCWSLGLGHVESGRQVSLGNIDDVNRESDDLNPDTVEPECC